MEGLVYLNLSRNHLRGGINSTIQQMEALECLDLSGNQLSGEIPASLGALPFLEILDLSNNNFSGEIPSGIQLQGFNASTYAGNIGLCGSPLPTCPGNEPPPSGHHGKLDDGDGDGDAFSNQSLIQEFYITIVLGFIVGFWGVIGTLLVKKSWRFAYFNFFDRIHDYVCLKAALYWRRLRILCCGIRGYLTTKLKRIEMDDRKCNTKSLSMFLVLVSIYTLKGGNGEGIRCIEKEKHALLKLKQEIIDPDNDLSSWGSEENKSECCSWRGVSCRDMHGHVIGLEFFNDGMVIQNVDWLSNLSSLFHLEFWGSSFTQSLETIMFRNLLMIPSLKKLSLMSCDFPNDTSSVDVYTNSTFSSLSFLDLNGVSSLTSLAFHWLFNVSTSLVSIDLSDNKLDCPIPDAFGHKLVFLEYLDLSGNRFDGGIPNSLLNLRSLKSLDLSHNRITGSLPESVGELSKLEFLDVSFNLLEGQISESHLSKLQNLEILDLSHNSLGPRFPTWVHTLSNVSHLDLSCANISDELPESFWDYLPRLAFLNLSHNHISGKLPDLSSKVFVRPSLDLSFNELSGLIPLFHHDTTRLYLSDNKFSGTISSLCKSNYDALFLLDLSNNRLSGQLPNCWENMSLTILDLSNNSFSGKIPNSLGRGLVALFLGNNNFSGELPFGLNNNKFLLILDVGGNKLTGKIPTWIGTDYARLAYLNIRGNNFFGSIPPEICHLTQIRILDLSRNNLSGTTPLHCFENFTNLIQKNSSLTDGVRDMIDSPPLLYKEMAKIVVQLKGREYEFSTTLYLLKLIDLSSNKIEGDIPTDVFRMKGLLSLNLSRNHLRGHIDPAVHQMESLESLDLSRNKLSGEIPMGLGDLPFLDFLDLSNNNFSGKIPPGTQLQGFSASAYAGNIGLCGPPLPRCPEDGPNPPLGDHGKQDKGDASGDAFPNQSFLKEFYITIVLGFIVGFWGVVGTLLLRKSWRYAYFNFFDSLCRKAVRRSR
ncbi:receptor-like protein EIX1 [Primulina tabacum]|uniref:receptor-like protein EIX1 n=1 Tax=Primulina tabacum TaxID=48773 RepID=UPI003F5974BD